MTLLSPRKAAEALGVSESSLKRWCDRGALQALRTAGGHRRLQAAEIIDFSRRSGQQLVRPELLGMRLGEPRSFKSHAHSVEAFLGGLLRGDEVCCRDIARSALVAGISVAEFADSYVATAFRRIGEQWAHGDAEVYQERRACQVCQGVLEEMSTLISVPNGKSPWAIGGSPEGDPYTLATATTSLVLRQNGWRSQSLGGNLPWTTLIAAVRDLKPGLFWLSVSAIAEPASFLKSYRQFYVASGSRTAVVVGGRALTKEIRSQMQYAAFCDDMQYLESFIASLKHVNRRSSRSR